MKCIAPKAKGRAGCHAASGAAAAAEGFLAHTVLKGRMAMSFLAALFNSPF